MSSDFTGNPTAAEPPSPAPGPGVAPIVRKPSDGDPLNAASVSQDFQTLADFEAWLTLREFFFEQLFGSGADGAVASGFGTLNMTRDMEWTNLTMLATDRINTNGFLPRVNGLYTAAAGAIIDCSASGTVPGGNNGTIGCGGLGGATAGGSAPALFGLGAAGGNSPAGGTGAAPTTPPFAWRSIPYCITGAGQVYAAGVPGTAYVRGGGGGGGGANGGGTGGVGGAGAGVPWLIAKLIAAGSAWTFQAIGGNGTAGVGGNAGGGSGGGGGAAVLIYNQKLGVVTISNIFTGGTGALGAGSGATGGGGTAGSTVYQIQF